MRLDKYLSNAKIGSRNDVHILLKDKKVFVNGKIITSYSFNIDENKDEIKVNDNIISYKKFHYLVLNKPAGYLSATEDNYQKTVMELVGDFAKFNVAPVGRLDIDTTGLLLLTNDGALAHRLISPKFHVEKTYKVKVNHILESRLIQTFEKGIELDDGYLTLPAKLKLLDEYNAELTIHEGKFHQVKRMFYAFGYEVITLKRISMGPLSLKSLEEGEYYILSPDEIEQLKKI
jgi:16S rRNA pseudouridine516 synthase